MNNDSLLDRQITSAEADQSKDMHVRISERLERELAVAQLRLESTGRPGRIAFEVRSRSRLPYHLHGYAVTWSVSGSESSELECRGRTAAGQLLSWEVCEPPAARGHCCTVRSPGAFDILGEAIRFIAQQMLIDSGVCEAPVKPAARQLRPDKPEVWVPPMHDHVAEFSEK